MDVKITSIQKDGAEIDFDDEEIVRTTGDVSTTARRSLANAWNAEDDTFVRTIMYETSLSVTVQVTFDNGTPFITE